MTRQTGTGGFVKRNLLAKQAAMMLSKLVDSEVALRPLRLSETIRNGRVNKHRHIGQPQKMRDFHNIVWLIARDLAHTEALGSRNAVCWGRICIGVAARHGSDCSCL